MYTQTEYLAYIGPKATAALNSNTCDYTVKVPCIYGTPQEGRNYVAPASKAITFEIQSAYSHRQIDLSTKIKAHEAVKVGIIRRYLAAQEAVASGLSQAEANKVAIGKMVAYIAAGCTVTEDNSTAKLQRELDQSLAQQAEMQICFNDLKSSVRLQQKFGIVTKLLVTTAQSVSA